MNAPGKGMLKVCSILLIIFGAIGVISSVASIACLSAAANLVNGLAATATDLGADVTDAMTTAAAAATSALTIGVTIGLVLGIIGGAAELVFGIIGVKNCADPAKGNLFITGGIVLCAIQLVSMILYFSVFSLIGFVLPILFIIGGVQNKNAAAAPVAPVA